MSKSSYHLQIFPTAEEDFEEIVDYISGERVSAARQFILKVETSLNNLVKFPLIGKIYEEVKIPHKGYRYIVVDNYLIFYKIENVSVNIYRIIHGARDYKSFL